MLGGSGSPPGSGKGGKGKGGGKEGGKGGGSQELGGMGPGGTGGKGKGGKGKGGKGGGKGGDSLSPVEPVDPFPPIGGGWGAFGGPQLGEDWNGNGAILMARSPQKNSRHMHDCEDDYVIECDDDCLYRYYNLRITNLFMLTSAYSLLQI